MAPTTCLTLSRSIMRNVTDISLHHLGAMRHVKVDKSMSYMENLYIFWGAAPLIVCIFQMASFTCLSRDHLFFWSPYVLQIRIWRKCDSTQAQTEIAFARSLDNRINFDNVTRTIIQPWNMSLNYIVILQLLCFIWNKDIKLFLLPFIIPIVDDNLSLLLTHFRRMRYLS